MVWVRNSAMRNSVHEKTKHKTAVAAMPPLASGRWIFRKLCHRVAPSMKAASLTSTGISSKNDFSICMAKVR
jgi:hypothetical protein